MKKTTMEISAPLLARAKSLAKEEGVTLRALVEEGLLNVVESKTRKKKFRLRKATFRGQGLHKDVSHLSWDQIRSLTYEGRGG